MTAAPSREGPRANEQINAPQIRLIDYTGDNLGVVPIGDALARAQETGLDLVEISPNADPPVCKILYFVNLIYVEQNMLNVSRKKQKIIEVKA
ncbi:MAG: translation initiation factor IF-3, partial [Kiloniellales bacterium]|nr:translation initiation factor IF-3 [Kiloniellales bacterium]